LTLSDGGKNRPLDLIFMGTPDFAATILGALIAAGHRIKVAYSQPPRPAGRGHRLQPSPVQALAERRGIEVRCPATLRDPGPQAAFAAIGADVAVVAAYGLILPPAILGAPRRGCLNVHASLLPRWRGAAPIQRAILAGDRDTGITIMRMDEGLDTGAMLLRKAVAIGPQTTAGALTDTLAALGGALIVEALARLDELEPQKQPETGITYARKLSRDEARLDWRGAATRLERQVRAFDPWPGAYFVAGDERVRVLAAETGGDLAGKTPGLVVDDRLTIATGDGAFRPTRLQRAGRGAMDADALLRGFNIPAGTVLPCPATD
jgi:methionyl-tRNA formyltransferase